MTKPPHSEDVTKLPKWAQYRIAVLTSNMESYRDQLAAAFGVRPTRVEVDPYRAAMGGDTPRLYVEDRAIIRFHIGGVNHIDVCLRGERLEITASGHSDMFVVKPHADNHLSAFFTERSDG